MKIPWKWRGESGENEEKQSRELPQRRVHLGIDYGTSWSKLVFRDMEARGGERSIVVRPTGEDDYRIPSLVAIEGDQIWFGHEAVVRGRTGATTYPSMKMLAAFPDHYHQIVRTLPRGVTADKLAALTILYLLQIGARAALRYLSQFEVRRSMTMTLGVPTSQLDNPDLAEKFASTARLASHMLRIRSQGLTQGISVSDALELIGAAESALSDASPINPTAWVRSEAIAALLWAFRSPDVPQGLYAAVDVGAGTTSSTWFRIMETHADGHRFKEGMVFYGAACKPPGADAVEAALAAASGIDDPIKIRGHADEYWNRAGLTGRAHATTVCQEIFATYRTAFGRAYQKDQQTRPWKEARLFLLGGGTQIRTVSDALRVTPYPPLGAPPPVIDPGRPDDLYEENGNLYKGDTHNLLVAYGLSYQNVDIPEAKAPSQVPDLKRSPEGKARPTHEDLYSD
jgi:hypothetical protein